MRIDFFTLRSKENGGGSHQNIEVLSEYLRKKGHILEIHTLFPGAEGKSFSELCAHIAAELRMIENTGVDVVLMYGHTFLWGAGFYKRGGGKLPIAVYLDSHLDSMKEQYRFGFMHRIKHRMWEIFVGNSLVKHIDLLIAVSPYLKERYARAGFPEDKFVIVPNAFSVSSQVEITRSANGTTRLLYTGRLSPEKGVDVLVDACALLPHGFSWRLRIVGDGPLREVIRKQIASHDLSEKITLVGWLEGDALTREYYSADIFVLPSRVPEPFGRSVVEAMRVHLPIIVPENGGAAWVAGDSALTFKNGDSNSLSQTITKLAADEGLCHMLSLKAGERASQFDVEKVGPELGVALRSLLV